MSEVKISPETGVVSYPEFVNNKSTKERFLEIARMGISYFDMNGLSKGERIDQDPSHDYAHTLRVMRLAENIVEEIGGDERTGLDQDVVWAAVAFHDLLTRSKKDPNSRKQDTDQSADYAKDLLETLNFNPGQIAAVTNAIHESSFIRGLKPETIEAKILFTADKLDQSGAMAIMRYSSSGGTMRRPLYNKEDPFGEADRRKDALKYTFDALLDRLPQIEKIILDTANPGEIVASAKAREIMKRRSLFVRRFMEEARIEIDEEQTNQGPRWINQVGALRIMQTFENSGKEGKIFYSSDDPFCENRNPQPDKYPLDALIQMQRTSNSNSGSAISEPIAKRRKEFLNNFLAEVRLELNGQ